MWYGTSMFKRRRLQDDEKDDVRISSSHIVSGHVGDEAMIISISDDSSNSGEERLAATTVAWDKIPWLFQKMQKLDEKDVASAIASLAEVMSDSDSDHDNEEKQSEGGDAHTNYDKAITLGGPAIVILAMKRFPLNQDIQAGACDCLSYLLLPDETDVPWTTVKLGGLEVIVSALSAFPNSLEVQSCGILALMNLFDSLDGADPVVQEAARIFANHLGGFKLVVSAMQRFQNDELLQHWGCGLFENLVAQIEFKGKMRDAGVVSAVGCSFEKHYDHEGVNATATAFMKTMFS